MSHLYVCHFSNGHIKVGRSIEPKGRIASHADRVACMGVELIEHHIEECVGPSEPREAALIARCAGAASARFKNEWFDGLDYLDVCEWAGQAARLALPGACDTPTDDGKVNFQAVVRALIARGMNQTQIGERCGLGQSSVSDVAAGRTKEPSYSVGKALIDMLAEQPAQPA